jgi:hypothetical protein
VPEATRAVSGLAITRDGLPVAAEQWATPTLMDAGKHEIVATASGHEPWKHQLELTDGTKLSVRVKAFEPAPGPKTAPAVAEAPVTTPAPQRTWQRPAGIAVMGLGAVGVAIGAVLGGLAIGKNSESNRDNHCDANPRDLGLQRDRGDQRWNAARGRRRRLVDRDRRGDDGLCREHRGAALLHRGSRNPGKGHLQGRAADVQYRRQRLRGLRGTGPPRGDGRLREHYRHHLRR